MWRPVVQRTVAQLRRLFPPRFDSEEGQATADRAELELATVTVFPVDRRLRQVCGGNHPAA